MTTTPSARPDPAAAPRVLITRAEAVVDERWDDYADCVRAAGGQPVAVDLDPWLATGFVPAHDALLVTAGIDVDPACYGEARSPRVQAVHRPRDEFEQALLRQALGRDIPVLCICRGHQLFNVFHGGTLLQHLAEREPHRARRGPSGTIDSGWHEVTVAPGTRLAAVYGAGPLRVNSRHHQAVTPGRVAPGLLPAAHAEAGPQAVVEALEAPDRRWAVSVQWHPERAEVAGGGALFAALVAAAHGGA